MNNTFTSHTSNFVNAMQTGVDPRTGQFMVNFPLVNLVGNNQLGPDLSLSLNYSPLNGNNTGFGTGFSLGITQFSNLTNLLELSSGEKYRVQPGSDIVRDQKLSNFRFAFTNGMNADDGYTVFWKEGKVELLMPVGTELFVTSRVTSPAGRLLHILWGWNGSSPQISRIDDEAATICSFSYGTRPVITVWPGTVDEYQIRFELTNHDQLDVVSLQVSETEILKWYFGYDAVSSLLLLTGVTYPTDMTDRVEYTLIEGLQFPSSSGIGSRLPVVISHTRNPGSGQPETKTYYEYTVQNFLGFNGNFGDWANDSDYLYTTLTDYVYGSTETVSDGNETITTVRVYNNYHLQVSEKVLNQGNSHLTEFTYYAQEGVFIESQPAQFQLVRERKDTWTNNEGLSRTQVTLTEFDDSGNPVREVAPDGTETKTTWYAATGEEGCPAEPHGFVRFIKERTVMPRQTEFSVPVHVTRYTYTALGDGANVVQDSVAQYTDDELLQKRNYAYITAHGPEYGRIIAITDTKYEDGETSDSFSSTLAFTTVINGGVMHQTTTFTGHDGLTAIFVRQQSAFSGLLLRETNAQNVTTAYTYDKMGRLRRRTVAPDTEYENTATWTYSIDQDGPLTTITDAVGNQTRLRLDGAGRIVGLQRLDSDNTQQWYDVATARYDAFGNTRTRSGYDWLTNTSTPESYHLEANTTFDPWGTPNLQIFSDGTRNRQDVDPVALIRSAYMQGNNGGSLQDSGTVTTTFDAVSQFPVTEQRTNTAGQVQGTVQYAWDGLGQLREETDERGSVTEHTYDAFGRELTRTLPDGSILTRTYAPHLSGEQVTSISVTGPDAQGQTRTWLLGTQTFDGLGRLTRQESGGRISQYGYTGASPVSDDILLPSGKHIQLTFIPELGNVVSSVTADGVLQTFSYDSTTADLLAAQEGGTENRNAWTSSGNLREETFIADGGSRKALYTWTLAGSPVTYTDITDRQTVYSRDEYGRVTSVTDGILMASLEYDALGRLRSQTAMDNATLSSLVTALEYNDFGQEIRRTVSDSRGISLTVSQTWLKNGLLENRITEQDGTELKNEHYDYDSRNRLVHYKVSGTVFPVDAYAHTILEQDYQYDALNNLTFVTTTLNDGSTDIATYHYEYSDDPTRLTRLTHTHTDYPQNIVLEYDAEGRMTKDEAGRALTYDVTGRLLSVSGENIPGGSYSYDALNRLVSQQAGSGDQRYLYYRTDELVNEVLVQQGRETRLIKLRHNCIGMSDGTDLTLTAGDQNDSLLWSRTGAGNDQLHTWSPYGYGESEDLLPCFNGERTDPVSGSYHLGNGYRAYNPVLMRFNCPDNLSPFGAGGINPYAYCVGDPINRTDPSGHLSVQDTAGIVVGSLGLVFAIITAGASVAAAGGVMAAMSAASVTSLVSGTVGVVSDIAAIASGAASEVNPELSAALGWVSLATGVVGGGSSVVGGMGILKGATTEQRQRLWRIQREGMSGRGAAKAPVSSVLQNKRQSSVSDDPRIDMYMDLGMFNRKPIYIHYTSGSGLERIVHQRRISSGANTSRRGGKAKPGVYLTMAKDAMNNDDAYLNLFLGAEKYRNSATHTLIFSFDDVTTPDKLTPQLVSSEGWAEEVIFKSDIIFNEINLIYAGKNPFI